MLRNVIEEFIANVSERGLDVPFLHLLPAMGFYDVHYIHGSFEFGKDFIAKKKVNGDDVQFVFQNKSGNIGLAEWRQNVSPQINEALYVQIGHPNYDDSIPLQVVVVTTGDLVGGAKISFHSFQESVLKRGAQLKPQFWSGSNLIEWFLEYGLESIARGEIPDYERQSAFFSLYSDALKGVANSRDWTAPI